MVLALTYLKQTGRSDPDLERRFIEKIEIGLQRLLGFEVRSEPGGFDWWGKPPANLFLSAYGLMSFLDLAEVTAVDPKLPRRIVAFLRSKQGEDGSWSPRNVKTGWSTDMARGKSFFLTAYVAWGLARAGEPDAKAVRWLEAHADEADDAYGLALASLALLTGDAANATGRRLVDKLVATRARDAEGVQWIPEYETGVGGRGRSAAIETTALAIQALLLDGRHRALATRGVDRLARWRDASGTFGTTQSTILALKALVAVESGSTPWEETGIRVLRGDETLALCRLVSTSTEPEYVDLGEVAPTEVRLDGDARVRAVLSRTTWHPWARLEPSRGRLALRVTWPEARLEVGREALAHVTVQNVGEAEASVVTLEIGIPPGCTVDAADVRAADARGPGAERVELGETEIVIYLRTLAPGEERTFEIPFTPRYALDVKTAPSKAYEYYVPEEEIVVEPGRVRAGGRVQGAGARGP